MAAGRDARLAEKTRDIRRRGDPGPDCGPDWSRPHPPPPAGPDKLENYIILAGQRYNTQHALAVSLSVLYNLFDGKHC